MDVSVDQILMFLGEEVVKGRLANLEVEELRKRVAQLETKNPVHPVYKEAEEDASQEHLTERDSPAKLGYLQELR